MNVIFSKHWPRLASLVHDGDDDFYAGLLRYSRLLIHLPRTTKEKGSPQVGKDGIAALCWTQILFSTIESRTLYTSSNVIKPSRIFGALHFREVMTSGISESGQDSTVTATRSITNSAPTEYTCIRSIIDRL